MVVGRVGHHELREKRVPGGCIGSIGDEILPSYIGIIINRYI